MLPMSERNCASLSRMARSRRCCSLMSATKATYICSSSRAVRPTTSWMGMQRPSLWKQWVDSVVPMDGWIAFRKAGKDARAWLRKGSTMIWVTLWPIRL